MSDPADLADLLAATAKRDQAAFQALFRATRAKLYGVALRILKRHDLAEEVVQETYVNVWNNAARFDAAVASPVTWMATIARNRAIDLLRKRREASIEDEPAAMEIAADLPNPLAARETSEDLQRLMACLGRLDEERKRLVLLAYYDGLSREQLAARFAAPVNTIKTWLRRSLMEIRDCLGGRSGGE
jgi:RNA polymerase sigma-70 factor (ECF subfamily)